MANPQWPVSLPQYVTESGFTEQIQDQTIESQMETGPAKIRRRFTKSLRRFQVSMQMTAAQVSTFENFWQTTCRGGSIPFDWLHPRTRVASTLRFRNPAPMITTIGGGTAAVVQFNLEII